MDMSTPPRNHSFSAAIGSLLSRRLTLPAQAFIQTEALSGIVLLLAALVAIVWANTPLKDSYHDLWGTIVTLDLGFFSIEEDLQHWVNDGLMTLFFFVVGLEIKRELAHGELSSRKTAALPIMAALGGMVFPAAIYLSLNAGGEGERGWAIPMATDIAFAVGALALVGRRIPSELRIFLLALAIVDDIGAIIVIALFYSTGHSFEAMGVAVLLLLLMVGLFRAGVVELAIYLLLGVLFWAAMLKSGVHATIAGVVLGLLTPASPRFTAYDSLKSLEGLVRDFGQALDRGDRDEADTALKRIEEVVESTEAPLEKRERELHGFVSFFVIPVFALANAGLEMSGGALRDALSSSVTLGIFAGLLLGKFAGILSFSWLAVKTGIAVMPRGVRWMQLAGVSLLGGIGFTVSLFITGLAFEDPHLVSDAKIGIFGASLVAGAAGYVALRVIGRGSNTPEVVSNPD